MAWRCTGMSNLELVDNLKKANIIKTPRVYEVMKKIDRKDFCPRYAYEDAPQSISYGATISAPHMHAYALEHLEEYLQPNMKALDVGSGSGYLTACISEMVGSGGKVIGIEHIQELVTLSDRNMKKQHGHWIASGQVEFIVGDGRLGYPSEAPFDCIHVGAAAESKPTNLIAQLKAPGRLFAPIGTSEQCIMVYDKKADGTVEETKIMGVMYVPLTDVAKQRGQDHSY
ncbi:pcmt1 protein [Chlamydoabsidia padenii]|nr:pcmt1 protein [Chlamydoabsidia padenii]